LWARNPAVKNLVFCENTGVDLTPFGELWEKFAGGTPRRIELLSFEAAGIDPLKAKGLGEMSIVDHAVARSRLISGAGHILKVTGRYKLHNPEALFKQVADAPNLDIICGFRHKLNWADSRVFVVRPRFIPDFLAPLTSLIDDQDVWFEHVFAKAVHSAIAAGWQWDLPADWLDLEGVAGTKGTRMRQPFFRRLCSLAMHKVRHFAYER
jgi:hypothetical protein